MASYILMPKLGMDMEEGTIVSWYFEEGDAVKSGDPLCEITTDKAGMEIEAEEPGVLLKILYTEGDTVSVNREIAIIGRPGENIIVPDGSKNTQDTQNSDDVTMLAGGPSKDVSKKNLSEKIDAPAPDRETAVSSSTDAKQSEEGITSVQGRVFISPRAKKLANAHKVDYSEIPGSGDNGRIVEKDVIQYLENQENKEIGTATGGQAATASHGYEIIPFQGLRAIVAERMMKSLAASAQATHNVEVDMSKIVELHAAYNNTHNNNEKISEKKVSITGIVLKLTAQAIKKNLFMNSTLADEGIKVLSSINIGIAVAVEQGIVVPVVHDAVNKSIVEIAAECSVLVGKARNGNLTPRDVEGSTFTITNLGMYDVDSFTAIINPPEAGILAIGKIVEKPVVRNGSIVIRPISTFSLTYDHCIIDGAPAALFLKDVKRFSENPSLLL